MAFKHGKNASVYLGAVDLSTFLNSLETAIDVDTAETTTFHSAWKTHLPGVVAAKVTLGGLYDPTSTALPTLIDSLVPGNLTVCPAGAVAVGDLCRAMSAIDTSYAETSPVGGVVAIKASFLGTGAVAIAKVLHPFGTDTNTTTGSTVNDGAQSTTGWKASLHVTAVSAGSWVVKLQDASAANFSDGADVTGGAFTAATGATSQLLTGAAGATLRRYVRYVATRTGGSSSDTITFLLTYSRNN